MYQNQPPYPYQPQAANRSKTLALLISLTILYILLLFPAFLVIIATVMVVGAEGSSLGITILWYAVLFGTLAYPIMALGGTVAGWIFFAKQQYRKAKISGLVPLANVALVLVAIAMVFVFGE